MCAHPRWPSFQAIQAKKATIARTIIKAAERVLFVNMAVTLVRKFTVSA
jgi:hypothetical protein